MDQERSTFDSIVVGGGPAGLIAAIALARRGLRTVLLAPAAEHEDRRTTALLGSSVDILSALGVWEAIAAKAAPLRQLRLADGTRRLVRTPEVLFDCREIGRDAFGYNIANEALLAILRGAAAGQPDLEVISQAASAVTLNDEIVSVALPDGRSMFGKLVVAADGRHSISRAAASIKMAKRALPQFAVALNFAHTRPHHDVSTEFHTESGPFTLVPLPGLRSSLVWVCTAKEAERIRMTDDAELSEEIARKSHYIVGSVRIDGPRGVFPLGVEVAERFAVSRVALVGEAGHVIPPIGAQGLNLGVRDADAIARLAGDAVREGRDPGADDVLSAYDVERRADVRSRAVAVEMLGRSLLSGFLPIHIARGFGLEIASRVPFLRRNLMRSGLGHDDGGQNTAESA
ncbi:MAG TPA: UbiH/UbiF family hydroxylase [Xanthobacteraceae bacterium]|nr:UbiH/UbiF family hydroxylase [Xanthobacteraceae bacterium]